jgi:thiol-disulfide isomerase/thioredoxin
MKCRVCGKKFETLSSLREHHKAVHPNVRFVIAKSRLTRTVLVAIIAFLIVTSGIVGYLIYAQAQKNAPTPSIDFSRNPIPESLYENLSGVSYSTLSSIGSNQSGVTPPSAISGQQPQLLGPNGKPEIFYIGGEWCPFCAAERWSIIVALSKFGNFTGLKYMESSASSQEPYPNTNTFSFLNSSYSSQYISFVAIEHTDRNKTNLEPVPPEQQSIWDGLTSGQEQIPFVYIYGQYFLNGAQYSPGTLSNLNWTQIASQLNDPASQVAKQVDGAANQLIGAICSALKSREMAYPQNLCGQSFATLSYDVNHFQTSSLMFSTFDDIQIAPTMRPEPSAIPLREFLQFNIAKKIPEK